MDGDEFPGEVPVRMCKGNRDAGVKGGDRLGCCVVVDDVRGTDGVVCGVINWLVRTRIGVSCGLERTARGYV